MSERSLRVLMLTLLCLGGASTAGALGPNRADLVNRQVLRVCADPANMPFSNEKGEGFENRIAELLAKDLGIKAEYTWFPQATGFIRRTLYAKMCDIVMGYAQGDELVLNTNAYYRSTYTILYRAGQGLDGLDDLGDPRLKGKRLGFVMRTPPGDLLVKHGLMEQAVPYHLFVDRRHFSPAEEMIQHIRSGHIDAGILWGPLAGFYASRGGEKLVVMPLLKEASGRRMSYRITFGVRPVDDEWKRQLNQIIARLQGEIDAILLEYGVPLLDDDNRPITTARR